jgi:hypothetical protein
MQLLSRLLVVFFFALFGGTTMLFCYSRFQHERPCLTSAGPGNDFVGCFVLLLFTLFGIALCVFGVYCLFTPKPVAPKFTLAPSAPPWVGMLAFAAAVAFMLLMFISALRGLIHGT